MPQLEFAVSDKYGLIALANIRLEETVPSEIELAPNLWITRSLPIALDSHWREWVGSIEAERLEKAALFLVAKGASRTPELLDNENKAYQNQAYYLYWGLLLTGFFQLYDYAPLQLTGAKQASGLDIRSISRMDKPEFIPGTPITTLDLRRLRNSAFVADAISQLIGRKKHPRLWKVIHGFSAGITSHLAEDRLHQFVRCIEGLIYPDIGKTERQFKSRSEVFVGPRDHELMGKLYELRSAVEHLHDPLTYIDGSASQEKVIALFRKSFEAEAIARYCLARFLRSPGLWPYFEDDSTLEEFWQLEKSEREKLWGAPLDISRISKEFRADFIRSEHIGLP